MPEPGPEGLSEAPVRQEVARDWETGRGWDATDTLSYPSLSLLFRRIFLGVKSKDSKRINLNVDFAKGKMNLELTKCPLVSFTGRLKLKRGLIKLSHLVHHECVALLHFCKHISMLWGTAQLLYSFLRGGHDLSPLLALHAAAHHS